MAKNSKNLMTQEIAPDNSIGGALLAIGVALVSGAAIYGGMEGAKAIKNGVQKKKEAKKAKEEIDKAEDLSKKLSKMSDDELAKAAKALRKEIDKRVSEEDDEEVES